MNLRRLLLALLLLGATGCAAMMPPPSSQAQAQEPEEEDEDTGVDGLLDIMRAFNEALNAQQFDRATQLLKRAQRGVHKASELTRSHPEFEDVEAMVDRASVRLADAIARDRERRRQEAIAELIRRGNEVLGRAASLYEELRQRPPTSEDVELLGTMNKTLIELRNDGIPYADDPAYRSHATDRDKKAEVVAQLERRAAWQVTAAKKLSDPIAAGLTAEQRAGKSTDPDAQAQAYHQASDAFVACINQVSDLEREAEYDAALLVDLPAGVVPIGALKPQCLKRSAEDRKRGDRLSWQVQVERSLAPLRRAMAAYTGASAPDVALSAASTALEALRNCENELGALLRHPGADAAAKLETPFGPLPQSRLVSQCRSEQASLRKAMSGLRWRVELASMQQPLADVAASTTAAAAGTTGAARLTLWAEAIAKIDACLSRAKELAAMPAVDTSYRLQTALGNLSVREMESYCAKQRASAEVESKKARESASVESFLESCRGDERSIVRKEGIPTRIEQVRDGRIFFYDAGKGGDARHFGFDTKGTQVDFWRRWQNQVAALVGELERVMKPLRSSGASGDKVAAAEAALPVLQVCDEMLAETRENPGYDASVVFNAPFGKLRAPDLAKACRGESQSIKRNLDAMRWQAKLEKLVQRLESASALLVEAGAAAKADDKLDLAGRALGGFRECSEGAAALPKEPGANSRLKVKGDKGTFTAATLGRACDKQEKAASRAVDDAVAAQKLEAFIATCHGDEVSVAQREGMPTRIEEAGGGRIFVYTPPKRGRKTPKSKRFAFDENGMRISEKQLRARPAPGAKP